MTLREECIINFIWQWDHHAKSCLKALFESQENSPAAALQALKQGQSHNPHVQEVYGYGFAELADFWTVLAQSSNHAPDFNEARINVEWQRGAHLGSLVSARGEWDAGRPLRAMVELLDGQHHNPGVMNLYRACFRADSAQLFGIVDAVLGH